MRKVDLVEFIMES